MEFAEFEELARPLQRRVANGFALIEGRIPALGTIERVERRLGAVLPEKYKGFLARYGGGGFGYVELLPLVDPDEPDRYADVWAENDRHFPERDFVAVAPVGTGDYWGFPVTDGRCDDRVWFHFHDCDDHKPVAADFLEFVAEYGLKSASDRALERRE